ncbi:MAG: hypothetical protein R3F05_16495 [Planctomycetota bacterium]
MLSLFLDELGIAHERGLIAGEPADAVPLRRLAAAITVLGGGYSEPWVHTYLDVLELGESPLWQHLPQARTLAGGAAVEKASAEDEEEPPAQPLEGTLGFPAAEQFTTLDIVLIEQIVAALQGAAGALEEEQIADLVDEVVQLNAQRHKSYFHAGFIDVLLDLDDRWADPEMNPSRLGWYLSGAVTGYMRRNQSLVALDVLRAHPEPVRLIGAGEHEATPMTLPQIFDILWEQAGPSAVCSWLQPRGAAAAGPSFLLRLLDAIKGLLRRYQLEHAAPLLDILESAFNQRQEQGDVVPDWILAQVRRQRAHALRLAGDFQQARQILEELVGSREQSEWGMAIADLGLMDAGYRALGDIRFPANEADVSTLIESLGRGVDRFSEAAAGDSDTGHGAYALGLLKALRGEPQEAVQLLSRAVAAMQRHDGIYAPLGILPRARLGLALAIAESLDAARAPQAVEYTAHAVASLGRAEVPSWLVRRILVGLSTVELAYAGQLAGEVKEVMGGALLEPGLAAGLLPTIDELRQMLLSRARDRVRPRASRFADFVTLAEACRACGDRTTQEEALDGLEGLAQGGTRVEEFLKLLEARLYDPAWSDEEARTIHMGLLERVGRCEEAARLLCEYGHARMSDGDARGLSEARDILSHVAELGVRELAQDLAARVEASTRRDRPVAAPERRGVVLLVGGNETQEQYKPQLEAYAREQWPLVRLEIRNTGWTSNWGRQLHAMEAVLRDAGAVVVLTMIRTKLGRSLRRICSEQGKPWVSCTGTGFASLRRSVETAVSLL